MNHDRIASTQRSLALAGAVLLILASASLGAYYGYTLGAHIHIALGVIFAGAAVGGEILKPLAAETAFHALRNRRWAFAGIAAVLTAICSVYSFSAELSLAAQSRSDLASFRQAAIQADSGLLERRNRAVAELSSLAVARPSDSLEPLIEKLRSTPGANGCNVMPDGPISRRICGEVNELLAESARFKRRTELEEEIRHADEQLGRSGARVSYADPLASAVSRYAAAAGVHAEPGEITPWMALIPVLFLELGSVFGLLIARQVGTRPADTPKNGLSESPEANSGSSGGTVARSGKTDSNTPQNPFSGSDNAVTANPALKAMLDRLRSAGGETVGSQRELAQILGTSKSTVHRSLHDLAAAGLVRLSTSPTGTSVAIV